MNAIRNIFGVFGELFAFLNDADRKWAYLLIGMLIISACLESVGLGLLAPLMQLMIDPTLLNNSRILGEIYSFFGFQEHRQFFIALAMTVLLFYVLKNCYLIFLNALQMKLITEKKNQLTSLLYRAYLDADYDFHLGKNPAELIRNINYIGRFTDGVCLAALNIVAELLVMLVISTVLMFVNYRVTLVAFAFLGLAVAIFYTITNSRIVHWAQLQSQNNVEATKWLNQGLNGIKEVKVSEKINFFQKKYLNYFEQLSFITRRLHFVNQLPRLYLEIVLIVAVVMLIIVSLLLNQQQFLSLLLVYFVAALRLSPSLNRILISSIGLREGSVIIGVLKASLDEMNVRRLDIVREKTKEMILPALDFQNSIQFQDVSFSYKGRSHSVLSGLNLKIQKGHSVGFVGPSGVGKTTAVDLLLGLLMPTQGKILVDDAEIAQVIPMWRKMISYVPQHIFLIDDSIRRNIAFGLDDKEIDDDLVKEVISVCRLDHIVNKFKDGIYQTIGDRGVRLSGGERQRLGIARALYRKPEVIIFDEATSALDNETEKEISKSIDELAGKKTILLIAHRLATVEKCDQIYFFKEGKILDSGTYSELINKNQEFSNMVSLR